MLQGLHWRAADMTGRQGKKPPRSVKTSSTLAGELAPAVVFSLSPTPILPSPSSRARQPGRLAFWLLLILGLILEGWYFLWYPLLARPSIEDDDPLLQAWGTHFPFLRAFYAMLLRPLSRLRGVSWLDLTQMTGYAHALMLVLGGALICMILAALVGRSRISAKTQRSLFWIVMPGSFLFALTMLGAPVSLSLWTRDLLRSWLLGRLVIDERVNPYAVDLASYDQDVAQVWLQSIPGGELAPPGTLATYGPVWADVCILIAQMVGDNAAMMVLGFRLIGLCTLLIMSWLVWAILARLKPEWRVTGTVLLAWNPLVLLFGVAFPHHELFAAMMVLLAVYFLLRDAPVLSWCFIVLAALVDLTCLLLLPVFLRMILIKASGFGPFLRVLWCLALLVLSALMLALAYLPFWQGWELTGWLGSIRQVFWSERALNSVVAALQSLLLHQPPYLTWLAMVYTWLVVMLVGLGVYLLFAFWFVDTTDLLLLCSCWLFLLLLLLRPVFWPWYVFLPLVLALCTARGRTVTLAVLLVVGGLLCYYFWLWRPIWGGQGLVTIGVPFLVWGWLSFFASTLRMTRGSRPEPASNPNSLGRPRRPPWFSRPWSSRPGRRLHP